MEGCSETASSETPREESSETRMISRRVILFYRTEDIYSQFHPSKFVVDGFRYNCAEQYMMHQKAVIFKDEDIARQILVETKPARIKALGRKVKNFNEAIWTDRCQDVVRRGNLEKFRQNIQLREELLSTKNSILAEASPFDRRWGIGLGKKDPKALDPRKWRGKNWLGEALMHVRQQLLDDGYGSNAPLHDSAVADEDKTCTDTNETKSAEDVNVHAHQLERTKDIPA